MSSPLPVLQVLVGFNNGPYDDPANITTIATPAGTLGAHNVWTDITGFVPDIDIKRGRQHELSQFNAGTLALTAVNNNDGRFNPWNLSSPYAGKLVPMVPVQIRATWLGTTYYLFTGHINSWAPKWGDVASQFIDLAASDAFRVLAGAELSGLVYQNQIKTDGATGFWPCFDQTGSHSAVELIAGASGTIVNSADNLNGQPLVCTFSGPGPGPLAAESSGYVSTGPFYSDTASGSTFTANYLSVPGINSSGPFSVEMWLQVPTGQFNNGFQPFVAGQIVTGNSNYWTWELLANPFRLQCQVQQFAGGTLLSVAYPTDGKWHHVVMTYTSTAMVIYIDGVQAGTTAGNGYATLTTAQGATLGELSNTTGIAGGMNISNVAFYATQAITATQVANHFSLGVGLGGPNFGTVDAQIKQALNIIGWPATAEDILPAVQHAQTNSQSLLSVSALQVLQNLEKTEEGALFMSGAGKVTFRDRATLAGANATYPQYAQPQVYFGDDVAAPASAGTWSTGAGGGTWSNGSGASQWWTISARYDPGDDMALDDLDVINQAVVTRVNGIAQIAANTTSQTANGLKSTSAGSVLHLTDAASLSHANWIVARASTALFRLRSLFVDLIDALGEDTVANTPASGQTYSRVGQLLGLDLMYRVRTKRVAVGFEQDAAVEGIQHKITPNSWNMTLALSTTDTYAIWSWGGNQ